jgi:hypothetical protein
MPQTTAIRCPHGADDATCRDCDREERELLSVLSTIDRDPETLEQFMADLDGWIESDDCLRAEYGDIVPRVAPEVL